MSFYGKSAILLGIMGVFGVAAVFVPQFAAGLMLGFAAFAFLTW